MFLVNLKTFLVLWTPQLLLASSFLVIFTFFILVSLEIFCYDFKQWNNTGIFITCKEVEKKSQCCCKKKYLDISSGVFCISTEKIKPNGQTAKNFYVVIFGGTPCIFSHSKTRSKLWSRMFWWHTSTLFKLLLIFSLNLRIFCQSICVGVDHCLHSTW